MSQPLKDVYKVNLAALLRRRDEDSPAPEPHEPNRERTMIISDHVREAADAYRHLTKAHPMADQSQKQLYRHLLDKCETPLYALRDKLNPPARRIGKENALTLARTIHSATHQLPSNLPSPLRFHVFRLAHNALPTRMRDKWRNMNTLCSLCGSAPETLAHLHTCTAASSAVAIIANYTPNKSSVVILQTAQPDDFIFRSSSRSNEERLTLLLFSRAVWRTRVHFTTKSFEPSFPTNAAHQIAAIFKELRAATTRKPKKRDRSRQVMEFQALFNALPPSTYVYTDGSAFGNPGPAGAGFLVERPSAPTAYRSFSLGHSNNHVGEMTALLEAAQHLLANPPLLPVVFFIDSTTTINIAEGRWKARSNKKLAKNLLKTLNLLELSTPFSFVWVPGHEGILGNEIADYLAKRGARGETSAEPPPQNVLLEFQTMMPKYSRHKCHHNLNHRNHLNHLNHLRQLNQVFADQPARNDKLPLSPG